jgi:YYY domain-containing protein
MPIDLIQQIWYLISWLIIIKILQLSVSSLFRPFFSRYSSYIAYPLSVLLFTLLSFYCARISFPVQVAVFPFFLVLLYQGLHGWIKKSDIKEDLKIDATFLIFFIFALEFRFINPIISHFSEQFMDHAFLASIMRTPIIPPPDPWFMGGDLSIYYYAGHFAFAALSLASFVPSTVSFNLILPTVFGISSVSLSMIGRLFLRRFSFLPLITLLLINPAIIWYLVQGKGLWNALNSTRWTISGCITEYPLFSLILGDAHTHVLGLWNQCFLISLLLYIILKWNEADNKSRAAIIFITAVSLGFTSVCNSWDFLIYAPLVVGTGMIIALRSRSETLVSRLIFMLTTPVLALLVWSPVILTLSTGAFKGIRWINTQLDPIQMLLYIGLFIFFFLIIYRTEFSLHPYILIIPFLLLAMGFQAASILSLPVICLISHLIRYRNNNSLFFPDLLGATGFIILLFCSLFQIALDSDASPLNTIFKLGYTAWLLLSIGMLLIIGKWMEDIDWSLPPGLILVPTLICIICLFSAPVFAQADLGKSLFGLSYAGGYFTLDGSAYLLHANSDDASAIEYVRSLPHETCILEGVGGDYSYAAPLSSFTGVQTVLGRYSHEFQWRGSRFGWIPERKDDIKKMYEEPDLSVSLFKKYHVTHIYAGDIEYNLYNVTLPLENLEPVWLGTRSILFKVMENGGN